MTLIAMVRRDRGGSYLLATDQNKDSNSRRARSLRQVLVLPPRAKLNPICDCACESALSLINDRRVSGTRLLDFIGDLTCLTSRNIVC